MNLIVPNHQAVVFDFNIITTPIAFGAAPSTPVSVSQILLSGRPFDSSQSKCLGPTSSRRLEIISRVK